MQERLGKTEGSFWKGAKVVKAGALGMGGEAGGAGLVQPREDMTSEAPKSPPLPTRRYWGDGARLLTVVQDGRMRYKCM